MKRPPWLALTHTSALVAGLAAGLVLAPDQESSEALAIVEQIKRDEGFRARPYRDTRGVLTIGYGLNLDEGITEAEGAYLLQVRVAGMGRDLEKRWPPFDDQPPAVQVALVNMAYQLGVSGLLGFHHMLAALEAGQYQDAARYALESKWADEVPLRAARIAGQIRGAG